MNVQVELNSKGNVISELFICENFPQVLARMIFSLYHIKLKINS